MLKQMYLKLKIIKSLLFEWQVIDLAALAAKPTYRTRRRGKNSNPEFKMQKSLMSNPKSRSPSEKPGKDTNPIYGVDKTSSRESV